MFSEFWAAYLSGTVGVLVGNPLDVLKVRLQAGKNAPAIERATWSTSLATAFKGLLHILLFLD